MEKLTFKKLLILIPYTVLLLLCCINFSLILKGVYTFFRIISPFITALCIAFVVNLPLKKIEPHLSKKLKPKIRRGISIFLSILIIIIFFTTIFIFLVPQINTSISTLREILPAYIENMKNYIFDLAVRMDFSTEILNRISAHFEGIINFAGAYVFEAIPKIFSFTMGVANGTINFFIGFIASFYLLSAKESMIIGLKRLIRAVFSEKISNYLMHVGEVSNKTFEAFITGQLTESCILGSLCTIGLFILQIEYAVLIGVVVGVSSLIPIFGSILGTIPCVLLLFVISPQQAIIFLIFIFILQQLEGDIIYPRVVGKSIGISGFWVMFAMILGGSLIGVFGLIIGIPIFAIFYALVSEWVDKKLENKN
ncbi:MAG: AI-2E family transporter [Clostridia bacterium]